MESFMEKLYEIRDFIKQHWVMFLIVLIAALLLLGYAAGFVTQMQVNGTDLAFGGVTEDATNPNIFYNLRIGLFTVSGLRTLGTFILIIAMVGLAIFAMRKLENKGEADPDRNFEYSTKSTYGTSGWMSRKEMHTALDVKKVSSTYGTILGALGNDVVSVVPTVRKDSVVQFTEADKQKSMRTNKHICVFGASGSMKSRAYVRNAIFQCARRQESLIITDPKGEMYEDTAEMLRNEGYNVKVFNLKDQIYSDSWDCLAEVTDEVMAQVFCSVIIQNTGGARGDHFWDNAEMNLLKALVLYVTIEHKKNDKPVTMPEVYRLLTTQNVSSLETMFRKLPQTHPAYVPYSIYAQAGDNVRGNVVIGLASRIQVFQSQVTKNITSYPEIDLTLPGKEKCAYYCAISDQDATFTFLSSLFFAFLFIKLVKYADNYGKTPGKLDVPVNFILDEFSNIGQIPDFEKKISTVRSRDINISVVIQNIPQLKSRYPNDVWQEIIGNCDTQLFLGCTDETTAKYISDRSGVATIDIQSEQTVRKTMTVAQYIPDYKRTESVGKRNVMTPDEVLRLPSRQALVIIRGEKVLKVDKYDFTRHPWSKKMKPCRMSARIPRWHRREMEAEAAGLELRSCAGELYYFDPKSGAFYERTAFINASDISKLTKSVPKGDPKRVEVEKTTGYQIVRGEDGAAMVVNVQTGETFPFYGFNSRGELLTHPQSSIDDVDETIEVVDVATNDFAEHDDVTEEEYVESEIPSQRFDSLILSNRRRRGSASLESDLLEPTVGSKKNPKPKPVSTQSVSAMEANSEEDDVPDIIEPSFAEAPQRVGSAQSEPDRIFDDVNDADDGSDDIWANIRPSNTPPPRVSADTTAVPGDSDDSRRTSMDSNHREKKPANSQQSTTQKQPQQAKKPKQNMDFFTLNPPEKPSKKKKDHAASTTTTSDEQVTPVITEKESSPPPLTPEAYLPDDAKESLAPVEQPAEEDTVPMTGESLTAAEVLGEMYMAKSGSRRKKGSRSSGSNEQRDEPPASTSRDEPEYDSDWGYAFANGDDLFD